MRYVALLRGVSPLNAKMADVRRCFENAGFTDVTTVLASGNVAFSSRAAPERTLARAIEAAMKKDLPRGFETQVRRSEHLQRLLDEDPFAAFRLPAKAKRIVTFLREPHRGALKLPLEHKVARARILALTDTEAFSAYLPNPRGPLFMALIEKTFGKGVTTRTWETVGKCARA